ncbi:PDZ domain-containing protein [Puia sp.]|uniref:PDZ domain-containing protein n=1 Tax=Puia sp. TaxID=2045100 RepID=UPI002F3EDCA0
MNNPLLKMAGLAALVLFLHTPGVAQTQGYAESDDNDTTPNRTRSFDEITIRHKGDKDAKVTVEIKNGEVFINGKPASEYKDEDLTITKRKFKTLGGGAYAFSDRDGEAMTLTPFRNFNGGGLSYDVAPRARKSTSGAFLGVTSLKQENGPDGARVGDVSEGSGAEKAGLKEGDLITKVDDKTIGGPEDLSKVIHGYKPGDKVAITFKRDGKEQKVTAELGRSRSNNYSYGFGDGMQYKMAPEIKRMMVPREYKYNLFGDNSLRLGIHAQDTEDGKGVKVLDVDDETAASKAGIMEGDIITRFDGQEVNSATRLAELARTTREDRTKTSIKVNLTRGGKAMEVEVKVPRKLKTADL